MKDGVSSKSRRLGLSVGPSSAVAETSEKGHDIQ